MQTLNELKNIKTAFEKISESAKKNKKEEKDIEASKVDVKPSDAAKSLEETESKTLSISSNDVMRNSLEMLKNGGRFTKLIDDTTRNSSKRNSKECTKSLFVNPSWSKTSICNLMKVSSFSFERRKSSTNKTSRKISRPLRLKKVDKTVDLPSKQERKSTPTSPCEEVDKETPKIISTCYATCRIHNYDDNSHTFEIIKSNRVNCFGDDNEKSDIVFVVLANGQTALFRSKSSKSLVNILFGESQ